MVRFGQEITRADVQKGIGKLGEQIGEPDLWNAKQQCECRAQKRRDGIYQEPPSRWTYRNAGSRPYLGFRISGLPALSHDAMPPSRFQILV
jgi:hypothetical protein